jgi:hypothetical protein
MGTCTARAAIIIERGPAGCGAGRDPHRLRLAARRRAYRYLNSDRPWVSV